MKRKGGFFVNLVDGEGYLIHISDIHSSMFKGKAAKLVQNKILVSAASYTLDPLTTDFDLIVTIVC